MGRSISHVSLSRLSDLIALHMGLNFPEDRWGDLNRAISKAAPALGFSDVQACANWLLEIPLGHTQIDVLAGVLTVGETHFFRDEKLWESLESEILPEIISARRTSGRCLRFWSAGCATGEEPYSMAMLLRRLVIDLAGWGVSILATDINRSFLRKAREGVYSHWSFRTVPPGIEERFFQAQKDQFCIDPDIMRMVKFSHLNLVKDPFPHASNDTECLDIIFCRNVLMYFTPENQERVIEAFSQCLVDGGWLILSAAEASIVGHPEFVARNFPGVVLHRKDSERRNGTNGFRIPLPPTVFEPPSAYFQPIDEPAPEFDPLAWVPPAISVEPVPQPPEAAEDRVAFEDVAGPTEEDLVQESAALYDRGDYGEMIDRLFTAVNRRQLRGNHGPVAMAMLTKAYANQGKLDHALEWSDRTVASDKLNADYHYLRGTILQELGRIEEASAAMNRAVFLDPHLVLAHFALGNLARLRGRYKDSDRHYKNALAILDGYSDDDAVPASEGLTAGRLAEIIVAVTKESPHDRT
ncbi:MAG: chemotaxis protein CheR [Desulfomonile tiedjei]|nr:chemotaxis protein CheR [Desulfomonile tiedjei]